MGWAVRESNPQWHHSPLPPTKPPKKAGGDYPGSTLACELVTPHIVYLIWRRYVDQIYNVEEDSQYNVRSCSMGVVENAQGKPWEVRGVKVEFVVSPPNTDSEGQALGEGSGSGCQHVGVNRAGGAQGVLGGLLLGGILEQLISSAEDQLRETQECISWYQRAEEKARQQLENLKQLQQLAEQETQDD